MRVIRLTVYMCLAEDVWCRVDRDSVVRELVVNVIRHARAVAAAVKTTVSGHRLTSRYTRRNGNAIWVAVENHDGMTCPGAGADDFKADITTSSVPVRIRTTCNGACVRRVNSSAAITPHVPTSVSSCAPGSSIISASLSIACSSLIGRKWRA